MEITVGASGFSGYGVVKAAVVVFPFERAQEWQEVGFFQLYCEVNV